MAQKPQKSEMYCGEESVNTVGEKSHIVEDSCDLVLCASECERHSGAGALCASTCGPTLSTASQQHRELS